MLEVGQVVKPEDVEWLAENLYEVDKEIKRDRGLVNDKAKEILKFKFGMDEHGAHMFITKIALDTRKSKVEVGLGIITNVE